MSPSSSSALGECANTVSEDMGRYHIEELLTAVRQCLPQREREKAFPLSRRDCFNREQTLSAKPQRHGGHLELESAVNKVIGPCLCHILSGIERLCFTDLAAVQADLDAQAIVTRPIRIFGPTLELERTAISS